MSLPQEASVSAHPMRARAETASAPVLLQSRSSNVLQHAGASLDDSAWLQQRDPAGVSDSGSLESAVGWAVLPPLLRSGTGASSLALQDGSQAGEQQTAPSARRSDAGLTTRNSASIRFPGSNQEPAQELVRATPSSCPPWGSEVSGSHNSAMNTPTQDLELASDANTGARQSGDGRHLPAGVEESPVGCVPRVSSEFQQISGRSGSVAHVPTAARRHSAPA